MLNKFYLTLGSVLLVGYSVMAFSGWELGDPARHTIPADQRGNYRSSIFWYSSGYRGGK